MTETNLGEALDPAEANADAEITTNDTVTEEISTENEPAVEEGVETKPDEIPVDESESEVEPEKTPTSVNKRLNKMYAEKRQAEEKLQVEARRSLELEQRLAQMQGVQQPSLSPNDPYAPMEPNEADPKYANNPRAYIRDCVAFERNTLIYHSQKNQAQQQQARLDQEHNKRILQAHERYGDYEEKVSNLNSIKVSSDNPTITVLSQTLKGLDNSADIMYYLGCDIEKGGTECQDLLNRDPYSAAAALGRISAKLENNVESRKPNAPPPPRKIKGQGSTSIPNNWNTISIDDLSKKLRQTY